MTKIIVILFCFFVLTSCSDNNLITDKFTIYGDTIIGSKNQRQDWAIKLDRHGNFEYLLLGSGQNEQYVYLNKSGYVDQIANYKGGQVETYMQFYPNGQLQKIKWKDREKPHVNSQTIDFAKSESKSLIINDNFTNVPVVSGVRDTFEINSDHLLTFRDICGPGPTKYEIEYIIEQSPNLKTEISSDKSGIHISANKSGIYRLVAKIRTTFLSEPNKKDVPPGGTFFKLDLDLIFK